jgi:hypothetical protein
MTRALPPDHPDDLPDAVPHFTSRRKAERLPPLRPASPSNGLERVVPPPAGKPSRDYPPLPVWARLMLVLYIVVVVLAALAMVLS